MPKKLSSIYVKYSWVVWIKNIRMSHICVFDFSNHSAYLSQIKKKKKISNKIKFKLVKNTAQKKQFALRDHLFSGNPLKLMGFKWILWADVGCVKQDRSAKETPLTPPKGAPEAGGPEPTVD